MAQKTQIRQELFAREYVIDLNGTRAALAAGYSERTANEQASRLLANRKVRALIDRLLSKRASKLESRAERVIEELERLAYSNMADFMAVDENGKPTGLDLSRVTRDQAAAIQEITEDTTGGSGDGERRLILRTKFKLAEKTKSLELLAKHHKLLTDKIEVTGLEALGEKLSKARHRSGE